MQSKINITLGIPSTDNSDRYFSFRLQQSLHNEPSEHSKSSKIFVVTGMEDDFPNFSRLLKKQGVLDKYLKWQFNDGHLVILGNCLNKKEHFTEFLWLIYALEEEARKRGGYVHFILGRHEIMNMNGPWRYIHPQYAESANPKKSSTALYDANQELWRWLRTKNIMEKIGNILFAPAGVVQELLTQGITLNDINHFARIHYTQTNGASDYLLEILQNSYQNILLHPSSYQNSATEALVDSTLAQFHVNTIITSFATESLVYSSYKGKIININPIYTTNIPSGLLIKHKKIYTADMEGKKEKIN